MGTERIYQTVLRVAAAHADRNPVRTHLDIGPGAGRLITLFRERFGVATRACDYTDTLLKLPGQGVDIVDLNQQPLPYPDNSFDVVTATEVVEHLERYREVLRDICRVVRPGGICVLTTPNILNLIRACAFFGSAFGICLARFR